MKTIMLFEMTSYVVAILFLVSAGGSLAIEPLQEKTEVIGVGKAAESALSWESHSVGTPSSGPFKAPRSAPRGAS